MQKTGQEAFTENGASIGVSVLDFWRFSYSELNSDPRDDIAEYLVSLALGVREPYNKKDWTLFDIDYNGNPIEVKSTSYYQTWRKDGKTTENRTFSIRKATAPDETEARRHSEVYVFCVLNGKTEETADPLRLENWEFYIIPTAIINEQCGDNKTISLSRIKSMGYSAKGFRQIKDAVDAALVCHPGGKDVCR